MMNLSSLFSHCSAFYEDIIICLVFITKGEIFARVTVFTLEHQLFHLCNKEKKAKKMWIRRELLNSDSQRWQQLPSPSNEEARLPGRIGDLKLPSAAVTNLYQHYRSISAELAARALLYFFTENNAGKLTEVNEQREWWGKTPKNVNPKPESCSRDCTNLSVPFQTLFREKKKTKKKPLSIKGNCTSVKINY